jgi:hypothetical protein
MVVNNFFFVSHNFSYVGTAVCNCIETYEFVFTQKYNKKIITGWLKVSRLTVEVRYWRAVSPCHYATYFTVCDRSN